MSLEPIILAELQRGGPPLWVPGRTYPKGWEVRSPANLQRFVRKVAGAGDTDPSADTDNWEPWSKTVDTKLEALAQSVTNITAKIAVQPRKVIVYCNNSRTVRAPFTGWLRARIMGSAGSGAAGGEGSSPSSGNGATVAFVKVLVTKGDEIVVTLGAGGGVPAATNSGVNNGNQGGTTTVTGPNGLNASIPGGRGGVNGASPSPNAAPTGVDEYWLGGLGVAPLIAGWVCGGASAALLEGTPSGFDGGKGGPSAGAGAGIGAPGGNSGGDPGGSGGPALTSLSAGLDVGTESYCRLLLQVNGGSVSAPGCGGKDGTYGGFGAGGGGIQNGTGGGGGRGGGGASATNGYQSGLGGGAFVTLEFEEKN